MMVKSSIMSPMDPSLILNSASIVLSVGAMTLVSRLNTAIIRAIMIKVNLC